MRKIIKSIICILVIYAVWWTVCDLEILVPYLLPTPEKVWNTFKTMLASGELKKSLIVSLGRVLRGFSWAFCLAFIIAIISHLLPKIAEFYSFLIEFFRNVPPLSLIPLLIIWFGIGEQTKTIIIFLASFFPMYISISTGFNRCDSKLIEVGNMFGYSKLKNFFKITLPSARYDIITGIKIGLGYSWRAIIGAEMIAASSGLGYTILFAQQMSRTDKVIIGIIMIGITGCICDLIFGFIARKIAQKESTL